MGSKTFYDEEAKIWSGPTFDSIFHPDVSVGQIVLYMFGKNPNAVAQIFDPTGEKMQYNELQRRATRIALNLQKRGLHQSDIIGICASNTPNIGPLALGALLAGIPFSPLDPTFCKNEMKHIFGITKPKIMFCDGHIYEEMKQSLKEIDLDCPIYTVYEHIEGVPSIDEFLEPHPRELFFQSPKLENGGDQLAIILCSSGTTGPVKGVGLSHKALIDATCLRSFSPHVIFSFSTLYWGSGLVTMLLCALTGSTRVMTNKLFTPELFLEIIERHKVSFIIAGPSVLAMTLYSEEITKANLDSVKIVSVGGSAIPDQIMTDFRNFLPKQALLSISYGMTEICQTIAKGSGNNSGGIGMLAFNSMVKIVDEDGNNLGIDQQGEICLQSKNKWPGYYNNPEATALIYKNGWIHSGDIGYFNKEGVLHIIDRKKDILKYQNYQVYPTEIEMVINKIPDVVQVCVCGLDDIVSRDLPAAAIVKKPGSNLTTEDVEKFVAEQLANHMHLHGGAYFVDELPKAPSGKVMRREVKKLLESRKC